jgi:hypothetical protein
MTGSESKITICRSTRKIMNYGLVWPNEDGETNPGKCFFVKVAIYAIVALLYFIIVCRHFILNLKSNLSLKNNVHNLKQNLSDHQNLNLTEDIAVLFSSFIGGSYMSFIYVKNGPKIVLLLEDLSNFNHFGRPPNFEERERVLNHLSKCSFMFIAVGSFFYNMVKLYKKPECQKRNIEENLNENCGIIAPVWFPFNIDYFPIFQLASICMYACTVLVTRSALVITYHVYEIAQYIVMRINHLNSMIVKCFDWDYESCRDNLRNCILYHAEIIE